MCICASLHGKYLCVFFYLKTNGFILNLKIVIFDFFCFFHKIFSLIFSFYFSERPQKIFGKFSDNSLLPNPFIIIPFLVSLRLSIFYLYVIHWLTLLLGVYTSLPKFLVTSPLLTCLHFLSLPSICAHFFHSTPFLLYKYCPFFCTQRPSTVSMRSHETNGIWFLFYLFFWKIFKLWTSVTCSKY